jgi:predicted GNAT family acetyltransferase
MSESVDVNLNNVAVTRNEEAHRFELCVNGLRSVLTYRLSPGRIVLLHTEVPQPFEGQGLAAKLTRFALDFAREKHLRVVPLCPYASSFLRKHKEYQDLVSAEDLQKLLSR